MNVIQFLASTNGRWIRVIAGIVLIAAGLTGGIGDAGSASVLAAGYAGLNLLDFLVVLAGASLMGVTLSRTGTIDPNLQEFRSLNNDGGSLRNDAAVFRRVLCFEAPPVPPVVPPPPPPPSAPPTSFGGGCGCR